MISIVLGMLGNSSTLAATLAALVTSVLFLLRVFKYNSLMGMLIDLVWYLSPPLSAKLRKMRGTEVITRTLTISTKQAQFFRPPEMATLVSGVIRDALPRHVSDGYSLEDADGEHLRSEVQNQLPASLEISKYTNRVRRIQRGRGQDGRGLFVYAADYEITTNYMLFRHSADLNVLIACAFVDDEADYHLVEHLLNQALVRLQM